MSMILTNSLIREARPAAAAAFVALALQGCGGSGNNPPPMPPTATISVNPTTITVGQSLQTAAGPFAQDGLWGIAFGNDGMLNGVSLNQPHNTLFFTAGPNKAANGLYGRIDLPPL